MKCKLCGHDFEMGYDGSVYGCDECAGVIRDEFGYMSIPFNLINSELPDGVVIIPDEFGEHEYVLQFYDDNVKYGDPIVKQAMKVVERYQSTDWKDSFR